LKCILVVHGFLLVGKLIQLTISLLLAVVVAVAVKTEKAPQEVVALVVFCRVL
jgi:hypothetical protein